MVWEIVFMLLILKIPIVYLCVVVWWAIKAEPSPPDLAEVAVVADTPPARRASAASSGTPPAAAPALPGPWWRRLTTPTTRRGTRMSTLEARSDRHSPADIVAGFLVVGSFVLSALALGLGLILELDARPARTAFAAIILALVSARLSGRYQSFALKAALFAMFAWVVGMTLAVLTENPLI